MNGFLCECQNSSAKGGAAGVRPNNKYAVQMDYTPLWVRVVVGVFCFVLALFSFLNVYIIVNGFLKEHGLPSGFGLTPIVVVPNEEGEQ